MLRNMLLLPLLLLMLLMLAHESRGRCVVYRAAWCHLRCHWSLSLRFGHLRCAQCARVATFPATFWSIFDFWMSVTLHIVSLPS